MDLNHTVNNTIPIVTVDGPSGAGKGTLSAHIANYLATPTTLSREFSYLKTEWSAMKPQINNKQKYINALKDVSIEDVRNFYQKVLAHKQSGQEILVQVQGEKFKGKPLLRVGSEQNITDVDVLAK